MKTTIKAIMGTIACSLLCLIILYLSFTSYLSGDHRTPPTRAAEIRFTIGKAVFEAYMAMPQALARLGVQGAKSDQKEMRMAIATLISTLVYGAAIYFCISRIRRKTKSRQQGGPAYPPQGVGSADP